MEHPEDPTEQPTCSNKQSEACEQGENAPEPMECADPSGQTEELLELRLSDQEPSEPVVLSSESEEQPPEPASAEQPKLDDAATLAQRFVSEEWLTRFVEQLGRAPPLWRPGMHTPQAASTIREKSKRGFAYTRLLSALEPNTVGGSKARILRAQLMCKLFFKTLKQHLRAAASKALESNPEASPDEALRGCPEWARRADAFLNQMPLMVAHLNALRNDGDKKKRKPHAPVSPLPRAALLHAAKRPVGGAAGAALMRRVVRGMRRAAAKCGGPTRAAAREVARSLGDKEARIFTLWCGMRKLSMYKLRATVARGDAPTDTGRLDALDWAIVDLLLIYNAEILNESQYRNYEQLSALLGTFHLVQRFELERHQEKVAPQEWVDAARWYSRNRVQMSAVALQRRWYELKMDTRRRFQAQSRGGGGGGGGSTSLPLPLHQAIARRYGHVVTLSHLRSWRYMVADGAVAPPTSERGPAPGEDPVRRDLGDDDSSESDTAPAGDDDDVAIVEKSLETIDLSEDNRDEEKTKETVTRHSDTDGPALRPTTVVVDEQNVLDTIVPQVVVDTSGEPIVRLQRKRSLHVEPDKNRESGNSNEVSRNKIDKTIDINKEIVDLDAPSPRTDVVEALRELDFSNVETTIIFDSDDEEFTPNVNKDSEVPSNANEISVIGTNEVIADNESQTNDKTEKRYRRESSDSSDGNLVIDFGDDVNRENESSDSDAENTSSLLEPRKCADTDNTRHETVWKAIEKEMLPQPLDALPPVAGHRKSIEEVSLENRTNYPMLSEMLVSKCIFEDQSPADKNMNVYSNTTIHQQSKTPKVYSNKKGEDSRTNRKTRKVSDLIREARGEEADMSSGDSSRSSDDSEEREQENETAPIDPKLLMYAVVLLERFPLPILKPVSTRLQPMSSRASSSPSPREPSRCPSPEASSLLIKSELRSPSPLLFTSPPRVSTPLLSRITPPRATSPLCETPSLPLSLIRKNLHPDSLFHYLATTLCPKFVFNEKNVPLIRMCKPCSVVVQRMDLSDKGRVGSRVAKKVELPDIEEVRRNNRCMLTAQVAPRRARRASGSSVSPSSGSDSDWTPDEDSGESPEPEPEPGEGRGAAPAAAPATPTPTTQVDAAELARLLNNLGGAENETDCGHSKSTGMRGPAAAVYASNCERCAARVLSAPPISCHEARLQRQLLRRAVRMARTPQELNTTTTTSATTASATTTTIATPTTSTSTTITTTATSTIPTTATPTIVMTKAPEKRERSKRKKRKIRPLTPPPAPRSRPRSPVDAEAAAREWLRQKNIAAEKFGVKPRSYKKIVSPAPVQDNTPPATIQPIQADITPSDSASNPQQPKEFSLVLNNAMSGATVLPLTQENLAKHSGATFRASSSTAPTLFNPDAVADINKKLGALAPQEPLGFRPVITNVQSLSKFANNPKLTPPLRLNKESLLLLNKKDIAQKNIIIIPTSKHQAKIGVAQENTKDKEIIENQLPQVVNVAGGIHLPPSSIGQGLHLVVSQKNTQKNTSLLSNYQPNIVVSGNVIQGVQTASRTSNLPQYVVTSMSQNRPPLILNSVLAGSQPSQPSLVLSSSNSTGQTVLITTMPRMSTVVTSQPSALFSSMPDRAVHPAPMVVRSVQAGPSSAAVQPVSPVPPVPAPAAEQAERVHQDIPDNILMTPRLSWTPTVASREWARGRDSTALCVLCTGPQQDPGWLIAPRPGVMYVLVSEEQPPPPAPAYWALRPRVRLELPGEEDGEPPKKRPKVLLPASASNTTPSASNTTTSASTDSANKPGYLKVRAFARMVPEAEEAAEADAGGHKEAEKLLAPPRVFVNKTVYQKMGDDPLVYAKLLVAVPGPRLCRALLARGSPLQLYCLRTGKLYPLDAEPKKDVSRITLSGDEEVSGALLMMARRLYQGDSTDTEPDQEMESNPEQERNAVEHVVDDIYVEEFTDPAPTSEHAGQHAVQHAGQQVAQRAGQPAKRPGDAHSILLNILATASKTIIQNQTQPPSAPPAPPAPAEVIELSDED